LKETGATSRAYRGEHGTYEEYFLAKKGGRIEVTSYPIQYYAVRI
jgi:hypothetical protein